MDFRKADESAPARHRPIEEARTRTSEVQEDLALAGAELQLSNTQLHRHLPESQKKGDIGKALQQTAAVEEKLVDASDELRVVGELLQEEIVQRQELEKALG